MRDLGIIALSVFVAIQMVQTGFLYDLLAQSQEFRIIGSVIAGFFWTSIFTVAPATVALAEISHANSIWGVALFGAVGALLGDLIIFRFVKDNLSEDIAYLIQKAKKDRWFAVFKLKIFRWLTPLLGALIIASPLPDEIGLTLLGISQTQTKTLILVSLSFNFIGILIIGLVARQLI